MAENSDGEEKTEEPTGRRIQESRKKGQVPRSRELNTFAMMFFSSIALVFLGADMVSAMMRILTEGLSPERAYITDPKLLILRFQELFLDGIWAITPFLVLTIFVAIASSVLIGGWNFATAAFAPKYSKLDPIKGVKRILGVQGLIELVKAILKVSIIGAIAGVLLYKNVDLFVLLGRKDIKPAIADAGDQLVWFFLIMSASLILIAMIDVPFQLWNNRKQLRMTKYEIKQEHKSTEGSPETRSRIRQAQREIAQRRMMANVPKADVVITNPTHYSVALMYDQNKGGAPVVLAKGADLVAMKIRTIAIEKSIPILSSPALARSLYYNTEIDQEIPSGLYVAVAKILAYVYDLRRRPGTDFSTPLSMHDVPIPDDLRHD